MRWDLSLLGLGWGGNKFASHPNSTAHYMFDVLGAEGIFNTTVREAETGGGGAESDVGNSESDPDGVAGGIGFEVEGLGRRLLAVQTLGLRFVGSAGSAANVFLVQLAVTGLLLSGVLLLWGFYLFKQFDAPKDATAPDPILSGLMLGVCVRILLVAYGPLCVGAAYAMLQLVLSPGAATLAGSLGLVWLLLAAVVRA
jgi:hypothetical protein